MNVWEATQIAADWVDTYAARNPSFRGAHLMGGIIGMPMEASFPGTNDVDLGILLETEKPVQDVVDEEFRGVLIEAGLRTVEQYRSPETVLANPELASSLAAKSIVRDPSGFLGGIQLVVSAEYGRRRWVAARCEAEKQRLRTALERADRATTPVRFLEEMTWTLVNLSGLTAVAFLRQPTHRKCLVLLRDLLRAQGSQHLYDEALAVSGCAHLTRSQVQSYLNWSARAFDRAVQVWRTPFPLDFKLRPHLRPYLIDGIQLMVDEGNHREAMPWIFLLLHVSTIAIRNDAPAGETKKYDAILDECVNDLGVAQPEARSERVRHALEVMDSLAVVADEAVGRLSDDDHNS